MVNRFTVGDLAEEFSIDRDAAYGLIRFLLAVGAVGRKGVRKSEGGRGRGEDVYELVEDYECRLLEPFTAGAAAGD